MNTPKYFTSKVLFVFVLMLAAFSCSKGDECNPASIADAGPDQNVIGTSATLAGNQPQSGTGAWTIVSGTGGTLTDALNPATTFTGALGNSYVLKWTITGCPESEDDVTITFSCDPASAANAGPDQTVPGTSATLAANTPGSGSGAWSIISGAGGTIAQPSGPTSGFTGVIGTTYVLRWTVTCPQSQDDVQITFTNTNPELLTVDKTNVINGDIITVTGVNFTANYNGGSQINSVKTADPFVGQEVFLSILSRSATVIKAVVTGTNGGANGTYNLRYNKKPDAGAATLFPSNLNVTINSTTANQFFTSSTFTATNLTKGSEASFGVKNGSLTAADYTVQLIRYDYTTGVSTEYSVTNVTVTALGYGGTMDKIAFTIPANQPTDSYYVKVTYGGVTLIGGWGSSLNIF